MISIVIPSYNNSSYITEAISSIRNQNLGSDAEIIIIDDGSTDNTEEVIDGLMKKDSGIRYFRQNHSFASGARNRGISEARGEWIYLLDADDVSEGCCLAALSEAANSNGASAAFGLTEDFISPELTNAQKECLRPRTDAYPGILPGASLIRKDIFDAIGLFDTSLSTGETIDWMIRFRESGFKSAAVTATVLRRRLHNNNTGRIRKAMEAADYARIIRRKISGKQ